MNGWPRRGNKLIWPELAPRRILHNTSTLEVKAIEGFAIKAKL
jgi:hypothetical protein